MTPPHSLSHSALFCYLQEVRKFLVQSGSKFDQALVVLPVDDVSAVEVVELVLE